MNKNTIQVLSFVSGLTLASVVIGVTLCKSDTLRNEIENQLSTVLKTTKSLVNAYKGLASKSKTAATFIRGESAETTRGESGATSEHKDKLGSKWDAIEASMV